MGYTKVHDQSGARCIACGAETDRLVLCKRCDSSFLRFTSKIRDFGEEYITLIRYHMNRIGVKPQMSSAKIYNGAIVRIDLAVLHDNESVANYLHDKLMSLGFEEVDYDGTVVVVRTGKRWLDDYTKLWQEGKVVTHG